MGISLSAYHSYAVYTLLHDPEDIRLVECSNKSLPGVDGSSRRGYYQTMQAAMSPIQTLQPERHVRKPYKEFVRYHHCSHARSFPGD